MPFRFGDYTLDESRRQLLRGDEPIRLSPKAYQLLTLLVHASPRALSKKELQDALWPETFVTEGNLPTTVAELRSVLGDDRKKPRFIRTLYGYGYSFAAPAQQPDAPQRSGKWKPASIAAALGVTAIIGIVSLRSAPSRRAAATDSIRSIAILPFDTSGTDRADQHLGLGLPDLVITRLSNVRQLIVRPTSAIRDYANRHAQSREAARQLQVDAILEGSIRTTPDRIRVTVQLFNAQEEKPIWADRFDEKRTDMFAIEDKISERMATALVMHLSANERSRLTKRYTADPEAYELYVQARYQHDRSVREGRLGMKDRIALMQKAVAKDPSYALAWAAMAEMYAGAGAFGELPPKFAFENAKAAVQRALMDDDLSEAHCAAAVIKMYSDLDYAGAEHEFNRALQLNPNNTLAMMHYGRLLLCLGRFDEAIAVRKREIEIDPFNPGALSFLASTYLTARQDDLGIQQCFRVLRMNPDYADAHLSLARIYTLRGDYDKAIEHARLAMRAGESVRGLACLGYALGTAGRKNEAASVLQQLTRDPNAQPFDLAIVHFALGHRDDVFRILDKAVDERTYAIRLKTEPIFQPLHSDPRFQSLLQRAGFGT